MNGLQDLDWIAVDWGTTNLRVWAMDAASRVLGNGGSAEGMGTLDRAGFEPALMRLIGGWLPPPDQSPITPDSPHAVAGDAMQLALFVEQFEQEARAARETDGFERHPHEAPFKTVVVTDLDSPCAEARVPAQAAQHLVDGLHGRGLTPGSG